MANSKVAAVNQCVLRTQHQRGRLGQGFARGRVACLELGCQQSDALTQHALPAGYIDNRSRIALLVYDTIEDRMNRTREERDQHEPADIGDRYAFGDRTLGIQSSPKLALW